MLASKTEPKPKYRSMHTVFSDGTETLERYDDFHNVIYSHEKGSDGSEFWFSESFDINGRKLTYLDSQGLEEVMQYDIFGNVKYYKNSVGVEYWRTYDKHNQLVYQKSADDGIHGGIFFEEWYTYDNFQNQLSYTNTKGVKTSNVYQYNERNQVIYCKSSDGTEYWRTYDKHGNETSFKNIKGYSYTVNYGYPGETDEHSN